MIVSDCLIANSYITIFAARRPSQVSNTLKDEFAAKASNPVYLSTLVPTQGWRKGASRSATIGNKMKSLKITNDEHDKVSEADSIEEIARNFPPPERFHHPPATDRYQSGDEANLPQAKQFSDSDVTESDSESEVDDRSAALEAVSKNGPDLKQCGSHQVKSLAGGTRSISAGRIQTQYEIPKWFPMGIKRMFLVDRHGGQLKFKELDRITRYRTALERTKRRKWKTYLEAGQARWQLQRALRRMRRKPLTKAFHQHRKSQYVTWKRKAIRSWERLEKLHLGIRVLDEAIDTNFRQERMIYRSTKLENKDKRCAFLGQLSRL